MTPYWWIYVLIACIYGCRSTQAVYCSMKVLRIKNGDYSLKAGNSVATFTCDPGYVMLGGKQIVCYGDTWTNDPPKCITNTCPKINGSVTIRIRELYNGAMLKFSCAVMHQLVGVDTLVCDGGSWNADPPNCTLWDPPMSCDFEDAKLCGWSHHDEDDQEWIWNTGATKTTRTGPRYDHTLGKDGLGHYMYFETSSPTRTGHEAWFSSPLYPVVYSDNYCFRFWYHSFGEAAMGELEVFVKPEFTNLSSLQPVFYVNTSFGEEWQFKQISVVKQSQPFQVVFVATRGSGYRSDYAIDDVDLKKCQEVTTTSVSPVTTRIVTTTPRTSTTSRASTTPKTMTITTTTMRTTTIPVTTSTMSSTTKLLTTTVSAGTTTNSTTSTGMTTTSVKPTTLSNTTSTKSPRTTAMSSTLSSTSASTTGIRDGLSSDSEQHKSGSNVTHIVVGVGLCIVVIVAVLIGIYVYRSRRHKFSWSKDSAYGTENPLYNVIESDECAVQFANFNGN